MKIFINTEFEGIHCYPDAPDEVAFLRDKHRHMFKLYAEMDVFHDDREIEFILLKRDITAFINNTFSRNEVGVIDIGANSCEMICHKICEHLCSKYGTNRHYKIIVSEDGENGAIYSAGDLG